MLAALVPGYALYWWYRSAADLQALANETRNDNARLNPVLMLFLALLSGTFVTMIVAVTLLAHATGAAQDRERTAGRTSTPLTLLMLLAVWLAGPVLVVLALILGGSSGTVAAALVVSLVLSCALTVVLYETLQFHLNSLWALQRDRAPTVAAVQVAPAQFGVA